MQSEMLVICNFYGHTLKNPLYSDASGMHLLLSNYPDAQAPDTLRPYEARIYHMGNTP